MHIAWAPGRRCGVGLTGAGSGTGRSRGLDPNVPQVDNVTVALHRTVFSVQKPYSCFSNRCRAELHELFDTIGARLPDHVS